MLLMKATANYGDSTAEIHFHPHKGGELIVNDPLRSWSARFENLVDVKTEFHNVVDDFVYSYGQVTIQRFNDGKPMLPKP